jgi:dTDP-4-dehydrorhamnose reductase
MSRTTLSDRHNMKILLLGKNGQVGWELQRALVSLGEVVALDRSCRADGLCGDLSKLESLAHVIRTVKPDVIVNAAAYTKVDKAETDREEAMLINASAVDVIAQEAKKLDALFVHYSTDYVFDGSGESPWVETDQAAPLNYYGASKLAGEQYIASSGCKALILRTSWVYGARGNNFASTMLRLAAEKESLQIISDQIGVPTGADLLADAVVQMIPMTITNPELCGLYHLSALGETSWYEYAQFVIDNARSEGVSLRVSAIDAIKTSQYPTAATRPRNSRLNTDKISNAFGLCLPDWEDGVMRMLKKLLSQ